MDDSSPSAAPSAEHAMSMYSTLDSKNFKLFTRNKDRMKSEVLNLVGLLSVIILLGISVQGSTTSINAMRAPPSESTALPWSNCDDWTNTEGTGGTLLPCYIYFGDDSDEANGCSNDLQSLMNDAVSFCQNAPANATEQARIYALTGQAIPMCVCSDPTQFTNVTWSIENNATNAFEFSPGLSGDYTMYAPSIGVTLEDVTTNNIEYRVNLTDEYNKVTMSLLPWQVAIEGAFLGKKLDIDVEYFPQEEYTTVDVGGVSFVPLYTVLLIFYALLSITTEICKEGKGSLRHGLFMIGLEPLVYWISWFRMMCLRMSFTLIPLAVVMKLLIFSSIDTMLLLTVFLIFALWAMMFCILCGLLNVHPDSVNSLLVLFPSLCGSLTYAYIPLLFEPSFEMVIPGYATIILSICFPPFAVAMFFVIALSYEQTHSTFNFLTALDMTPFEVSAAGIILSLSIGTFGISILNYYLIVKSRGSVARAPAAVNRTATDNAMHVGPNLNLISATNSKTTDMESGGNGVAVSVKLLSKHFVNNDGKINKAVDGLSVDFYENQITSFLGHNGAGKSTTISLLTGLFGPDGGDAMIQGLSIVNDMDKVRALLGVCPQENVLWDLLTVKDHMKLFSRIRGIPDSQAKAEIIELLKDIGLTDKKDTWAKDLSGERSHGPTGRISNFQSKWRNKLP